MRIAKTLEQIIQKTFSVRKEIGKCNTPNTGNKCSISETVGPFIVVTPQTPSLRQSTEILILHYQIIASFVVVTTASYEPGVTYHETQKPVEIPIYKKYAIPIPHPIPVSVQQQIKVPIPQPYQVQVPIPHPVPVVIEKNVEIPVEKLEPYVIEKKLSLFYISSRVPFVVEKPYAVTKEISVPISIPKPYPVHVPIYKHVFHHQSKGWDR
ncbi:uncharacterized protein LOC106637401 [Copidosoma floridanum]|uniref:uncharacterized protein LOC106637401 n=1 Tax=Copidosoma floridanum TaxID=29053 RepID=UPI000C6FA201|nr:uncharacterized protein LOC106637401 [Copidosoma floridanum]